MIEMMLRKQIAVLCYNDFMYRFVLSVVAFCLVLVAPVNAQALSEMQSGAISQNCSTIRQMLQSLQRVDSRTRAYLGSAYEVFLSNFIVPLNLSLVKNGHPSADAASIHSDILEARQQFNNKFIEYSQDFDRLLAIDCKSSPEAFYEQLVVVRKQRTVLESDVRNLKGLLEDYYSTIKILGGEL